MSSMLVQGLLKAQRNWSIRIYNSGQNVEMGARSRPAEAWDNKPDLLQRHVRKAQC